MTCHRKLLVLDIDNTLIHTVLLEGVTPASVLKYRDQLLEIFPNSIGLKGEDRAVIVPRPNLETFIQFLDSARERLDIGVYSTGTPQYLQTFLSQSLGWLIGNASFIWGINKCSQMDGITYKNLELLSAELGYSLNNILMVDDRNIVTPKRNWLNIKPFTVNKLSEAQSDRELLNIILPIRTFMMS